MKEMTTGKRNDDLEGLGKQYEVRECWTEIYS